MAAPEKFSAKEINPLGSLDEWEDDVLQRYPDPDTIAKEKAKEAYRNYDDPSRDTVREFYRLNHTHQSYEFVQQKKSDFLQFNRREMSVWDAFNFLNHANLNLPDSTLGSQNFGIARYGRSAPTSGLPILSPVNDTSRQIQLIVRIDF